MTRTRVFLSLLAAALVVALFAWLMRSVEWVDADVPVPPRGEAARDRFHAAKQLARGLGASVTTVRDFERLPPPAATLVLGSHRWNMFGDREAALRRWVEDGGHLVVLQSAWSATGETPGWVPMRSGRPPRRGGAASSPWAAAPDGPATDAPPSDRTAKAPPGSAAAARHARCGVLFEPPASAGAFGAPRSYRVCGAPSGVLFAREPLWQLASERGVVAARVSHGRGDITANAVAGSFDSGALLRDDGALAFAAMLQLRPGDVVWFFDEATRPPFLSLLWQHGAPALGLAALALALLLWRAGTRFGPLLADPPRARRSIGEQVRRTAAFIAADGGAALHRASVRALDDEARRSLAGYAGLVGARDRCDAIARRAHVDPALLLQAMNPSGRIDRRRLALAIARLERARRALLPERRTAVRRPPATDPSPS
jgi:uncharacterized protein DUF4350